MVERKERFLLFFSKWSIVDSNASDANVEFRPLFSDTSAKPGVKYLYRIYAKNSSGISEPSELVGPAKASCRILIDELANDSLMKNISAGVKFLPGWDATRARR